MNKVKVVRKMGTEQIMIKSQKGQQLNEHEVYAINSNEVGGLLHIDVEQKGNSFTLYYNVTGFITFREYLQNPLNKDSFAHILKNVLDCLKSVKNAYFHQENMLMDINQVMVNPATHNIHFVYVPIQGYTSEISLREFLMSIVQYGVFLSGEDTSYVSEYITILNNGINFSEFELEQFVNKLLGISSDVVEQKECPVCHAMLKKTASYCTQCGAKLHGNTGMTSKSVYDPFNEVPPVQPVQPPVQPVQPPIQPVQPPVQPVQPPVQPVQPPVQPVQPPVQPVNYSPLQPTGTTVLGVGPEGTTLKNPILYSASTYPYLIRLKNNEKIVVNKSSFRIGKERRYSDYFVADNNAVSRSHADIVTHGNRYYIIDLNSTNKTYVDGHAIAVQQEVEIFNNTRLRLANEDFVFYIDAVQR